MTYRIKRPKWILYRHTRDFDLTTTVAVNLKIYSKTSISKKSKEELLLKLKNLGQFKARNPKLPLDSINHNINTLDYYMFGYKDPDGKGRFLFGPLGNLFLENISNKINLSKIFLCMLWGIQFPNTFGTSDVFKIYPFRLIFKLLLDKRLDGRLYAFEVAYSVVFVEQIDDKKYEKLVKQILKIRRWSDDKIEQEFKKDEHVYVNATYEWDYYVSNFLVAGGVLTREGGKLICKLKQGKSTKRNLTRNYVSLNGNVKSLCTKLLREHSLYEKPLALNDPERLMIDVVKEIHSFRPQILINEIGRKENKNLKLPKLIEDYSNNRGGRTAYSFEDVLVDGFNSFYNVEACGLGGAGKTDVECLYTTENKKFAVDGKSTKNKLHSLSAGRLALHRRKIGAKYTIIVTPRYVPAVLDDIKKTDNVILLASTFAEYLYNHIDNNVRKIDYIDFDSIIAKNLGKDISKDVSDLTLERFASSAG